MPNRPELFRAFAELRQVYANAKQRGDTHELAKSFAILSDIRKHHGLDDKEDSTVRKHFAEWAVE